MIDPGLWLVCYEYRFDGIDLRGSVDLQVDSSATLDDIKNYVRVVTDEYSTFITNMVRLGSLNLDSDTPVCIGTVREP